MTCTRRRIMLIALFAVLLPAAVAQQKPAGAEYAGLISNVEGAGACFLQSSGVVRRITLKNFGAGSLHVGDKVRCDQGGSLVLELRGSDAPPQATASKEACSGCTIIGPSAANSWTTIRRVSLARNDPVAQPVDDWFKLAGAVRGSPVSIYSPPSGSPGGAVWPERFVIRWIPRNAPGTIALRIRDEVGNPLWPASGESTSVSSGAGELASPEARDVLMNYRKTGRRGPLTLVMVNSEGDEFTVQFSVISSEEEATLKQQLKVCDGQIGLMRYICRAYYFRQIGLYAEAAGEYDEALHALAPNSVDLQLHAIAAHRLTGNYRREEILLRQLPAGVKPPE